MLFVVPNPACSLMTANQGYERTYRSANNQMDLCQSVSVTPEWRYSDHINNVTFLKLEFQINRYKVKWGSSPLHTMSNSDSRIELFPSPIAPVLLSQLTCVHLILRGCRNLQFLLRCPLSYTGPSRMIEELKGIISRYTILMSFNQPDYDWLHALTTALDIDTSFTQS